ncbi:MAG: UTP--glucose-1-phosphate uridylyltransferase [Ruminococcaceae bacterium]|nr:UTP--glucose-1-phosphate uridylyltransferase [Oscillospiraceae bacterium]
MRKITKAVIPAAGFGTRVLPASKAVPKEMLAIVDEPAIQYIVEEAVNSGITDILIITNRGKGDIEDHFDRAPELERRLLDAGKMDLYESVVRPAQLANIYSLRQKEAKGLGHAVSCARSFIGNEPFAVLYGDDVIISDTPVLGQLMDAYERYGKGVVGVKEMSTDVVMRGSSLKIEPLAEGCFACSDMIEKPAHESQLFSHYTVLGRCILPPEIFDIIDHTPPGANGEIQLTDAMAELSRTVGMTAVDFIGKRYDLGNKLGMLQAAVEVGCKHPEIGDAFRAYLKELIHNL